MPETRVKEITVKSPAFRHEGMIPKKYTADGTNVSPALILSQVPEETKSMALIVEDPDAPSGVWVHWLVWNIFPSTRISEDTIPGTEGMNGFRAHHYKGPAPPLKAQRKKKQKRKNTLIKIIIITFYKK